jgi:predicted ATPase
MKLTKLSLTNFRSFGETQSIDFAAVTLLFGPNSVGKSSVLMALFYLQQILSKGQCDPLRIEALGDKYVGGFKNLVNGRDLNKSITIKVEYEKSDDIGSSYAYLADLIENQRGLELDSPTADAKSVGIELEISWSASAQTAYVSCYRLWLDGEEISELTSDAGLKQPMVTGLNYLHPLLLSAGHYEWISDCVHDEQPIHNELIWAALGAKGIDVPTHREIKQGADTLDDINNASDSPIHFTEDCFVSEFHETLNSSRIPHTEYDNPSYMSVVGPYPSIQLHADFAFSGFSGALPLLGKAINTSLNFDDEHTTAIVNEVLSDALVAPLDNLLAILNDSLCIGPLRIIPDSTYQVNPYPQAKDWHNGMAAWDILDKADINLLRSVDSWISSSDKLDLGYGLVFKVEKSFSEIKSVKSYVSRTNAEKQLDALIARSSSTNPSFLECDEKVTRHTYSIWDYSNDIGVSPSDIGVGVSQLMPLVVAAFNSKKGIVAIEQPELHTHPTVQVSVGDLLTQVDTDISFLVETHSEHLILRILKRIRQTTDNELPEGFTAVNPSDVSILYLEASGEGVKVRKMEVDEDGEFIGRWPNGFFAERREELM